MSPAGPGRLGELLGRARGVRVLVVGDLMLDRYLTGSVERVSPEAPVPVVRVESERTAIGGAGNVAANVTSLGGSCSVVGCAGADAEGDELLLALERCGVGREGVLRVPDRPTTVKTRVLAQHQQVVRFDREVDADVEPALAARLADKVRSLAEESDVLVAQDYDKGVLAPAVIRAVLDAAAARGVPCVVDPKRRRFFEYRGATLFKPNARELGDALGERIHPHDAAWMEAVLVRLSCEHLLVTLGDRGMALKTRGEGLRLFAAAARDVYDVSGAGDTVTAAVALALASGATAAEAAVLATHAAAVEVSKLGVQSVTPEEVSAHARAHPDPQSPSGGSR